MKKIKQWLVTLLSVIMLGSCRIVVTSELSVSVLEGIASGEHATVRVEAFAQDCQTDIHMKGINESVCALRHGLYGMEKNFQTSWDVNAVIKREKDKPKNTDIRFDDPLTIYYGENGTIVYVIGRQYMDMLKGDSNGRTVKFTTYLVNDTEEPKKLMVRGLWVNGKAIDTSGLEVSIEPNTKATIQLSDVGAEVALEKGYATTGMVVHEPS